ncbi:DUF1516 family protein [Staphylococcus aureus]
MLHLHILSWVLAIILFIATYLNISKNQGRSPFFKKCCTLIYAYSSHAVDVNFRILDINSVIYEWRGKSYVAYIEMLCGVAVVGLMEVSIAKRKRHEQSHTMFWITIALIIITMVLVILPLGPISKLFGIG